MATVLKSNLDSVSTTLDNLLHWSLAQTQGIHVHPVRVNLKDMVEEHVTLFNELARSKNIQLENNIAANLFAISDEGHLRLVLRNLINNAIKFSTSGGRVSISNQFESPFIKILVTDTGVGIEPDQLKSIFLRERLPSKEGTNRERGMGIGLMLCQEFVENNGGHLSVASEPGKGSVFAFTLKAA
jgi:two-component system, sensor histidine kinase and response regulator